MPSVPQGRSSEDRVYVGLLFEDYTPSVEGQILRDCLALQQALAPNEELVLVCESNKPDAVLNSLGLRRVPTVQIASIWIIYRTKEQWLAPPENCTTEIKRDLYVQIKNSKILREVDEQESTGYYLPPQGRLSPDTLSLERPAPNGYIPIDPSIFMIWGP